MKYRIEDTFDVDATRYWDVFFDDDYNTALFEHLDIDYTPVKLERTGEGEDLVIVREQELIPRRDVPKVIKKLAKGAIAYREHNRFFASEHRIEVQTVPSFLADKVVTKGSYWLEPTDDGGVKRIFEGECNVTIPVVGKSIEKIIVEEVKASYAKTADFTRRWMSERPSQGEA